MKRHFLAKTLLIIVPALLLLTPGTRAHADPITIGGCNSGVENQTLDDGSTMEEGIAVCAEDAQNHGEFVSCVAHLTNTWKRDGLIDGKEKGAVQRCAARATIPRQCEGDEECNDEVLCNGQELCIDGTCQAGAPIACPDDGLFCNGVESCEEAAGSCVSSGNPCAPGAECNEDTDICGCISDAECDDGLLCTGPETCVGGVCQPGTPVECLDNGFFCDGTEYCNEIAGSCISEGDPCGPLTMCNEETDMCESPFAAAFKRFMYQLQQAQ